MEGKVSFQLVSFRLIQFDLMVEGGFLGAWHYLSHYPDEVLGGVPASGFVKIQDYVPYTSSRGSHYRDPFLTGVSCPLQRFVIIPLLTQFIL